MVPPFSYPQYAAFTDPTRKKALYKNIPPLPWEFPCNILIQSLGLLSNGRLQNVIVNKLRQLIQVIYRI